MSHYIRTPKISAIYRYPVKGLSPEPLERVRLGVGATLPSDRLYAIENGPSGFDPAAARHAPKQRYLMLMRNDRLAWLRTRFDDASHTLSVESEGRTAIRGDLRWPRRRSVRRRRRHSRRRSPGGPEGPPSPHRSRSRLR